MRMPPRQIASPRARRLLAETKFDPRAIRGSGPGGRIVEADIRGALAGGVSAARPAGQTYVPASTMRLAIARRTSESFATVPHFYLRAEVDATALVDLRQQLVDEVEKLHGVRLTLTDFLLRAMAKALAEYPQANRIWHDQGLLEFATVDVGLMVAVPDGLVAAVVRKADTLSVLELARERSRLVAAARVGRLPGDAVGGGATSLSNLGEGRVDEFAAVIMPPQSSILAVGRLAPRPWVVDGSLTVRTTLRLCLSVDHRVLDGTAAAAYLGQIVRLLERPALLMGL